MDIEIKNSSTLSTRDNPKNPYLGITVPWVNESFSDISEKGRSLAAQLIADVFLAENEIGGNQKLLAITNDKLRGILDKKKIKLSPGTTIGEIAGIMNSGMAVLRENVGLAKPDAIGRIFK